MNRQITIKIIACGLVAVTLFGFGACNKKDKEKETTTTNTTTKSAWVDESFTSTSETTEATAEPNTQPETPVDATQATEGTTKAQAVEKTTKAPKPNTTQAPKPTNPPQTQAPAPTPPPQTQAPTNPPAPPAPAELTQQMKDDMVAELMNYARSIGYTDVYSNTMGENGNINTTVTPKSYNKDIELIKEMIEYEYRQGCIRCDVKWSSKTQNKILIDCFKN